MDPFKSSCAENWSVYGIPAFNDNYLWALVQESTQRCLMIDPGCPRSVLSFLDKQALTLCGILLTHHHADHIGGVEALLSQTTAHIPVLGTHTGRIPQVNTPVQGGTNITLEGLPIAVLDVPGHTRDHLAYVASPQSTGTQWLFCGDTLFSGGCGRLFEGTAEQMFDSLQTLKQLPDHTLIFCAHEYTASNLAFALSQQPENQAIQTHLAWVNAQREQDRSTLPSSMGLEKTINIFLQAKTSGEFKHLRKLKDCA
jgi:hydroxyacylglutathione hydrolase